MSGKPCEDMSPEICDDCYQELSCQFSQAHKPEPNGDPLLSDNPGGERCRANRVYLQCSNIECENCMHFY